MHDERREGKLILASNEGMTFATNFARLNQFSHDITIVFVSVLSKSR